MDSSKLKIKLFADGANKASIVEMYNQPWIQGLTTNPTLMCKEGITDYEAFAREVLEVVREKPISLEVFADEPDEMRRQARMIASWGENVYVKVPVTNTRGESCCDLVRELSHDGVRLNVTAILPLSQVSEVCDALRGGEPSFVSVFAGRIADTGRDPIPLMIEALEIVKTVEGCELIWASPRELLNIVQADAMGCHVITVTTDLLKKLPLLGKDLTQYSLETVQMFHNDAIKSRFSL